MAMNSAVTGGPLADDTFVPPFSSSSSFISSRWQDSSAPSGYSSSDWQPPTSAKPSDGSGEIVICPLADHPLVTKQPPPAVLVVSQQQQQQFRDNSSIFTISRAAVVPHSGLSGAYGDHHLSQQAASQQQQQQQQQQWKPQQQQHSASPSTHMHPNAIASWPHGQAVQSSDSDFQNGNDSQSMHLPVDIHSIKTGKETRTTIMVRHIPSRYTQAQLIDEIAVTGFRDKIDFLYQPIDFKSNCR